MQQENDEIKEPKGYVTVSTKLPSVDAIRLKMESNHLGIKHSEYVRKAIMEKINAGHISNEAGKNKVVYDQNRDSFNWLVELDDGKEKSILDNVSPEFIKQLKDELDLKLNEREQLLNKKKDDSVAVPKRLGEDQ